MTVVVEAAQPFGSLVTANFAAAFGRELGAVPGPVTAQNSAGSNALLAGGAQLVRHAADVFDVMSGANPWGGVKHYGHRRAPAMKDEGTCASGLLFLL